MKKKKLSGVIIILLFLVIILLIIQKALLKQGIEFSEYFPSVLLIDTEYNSVFTDTMRAKTLIAVFYASDCIFCQHEAKELSRNSQQFSGTKMLFITNQNVDSALFYKMRFRFDTIPHYYSLIDTSGVALNAFGIRSVPTTLIYGEDRKLIGAFEGEVNSDLLLKYIQQYGQND